MPTPQRRQPLAVVDRLIADPHRFGFFQAVRLLERWFARQEHLSSAEVLATRLKFRNSLSLSFPPSEVAEFKAVARDPVDIDVALPTAFGALDAATEQTHAPDEPRKSSSRAMARIEMTPAFMGLLGMGGALPTFYTDLFYQREIYQRDTAARAFLDIFQHRSVALFYQAWRKHRLAVQFEADRRNHFLPLVLAVAGLGQRALRERLKAREGGVSDDTLAYFAGMLQQRPVSAHGIRQVISAYFAAPVEIDQFVGRWFTLPPGNGTSLGQANAVLGRSALVGERVWQRDLRMRLTIGPLPRDKFRRFLPGGPAALALRELLTMLTGVSLEYEIRLSLRAQDVQGATLSSAGDGARLGWDSFLVTQGQQQDRSDAGYDIHTVH
jgi:type VI secretion system protein ImpH